MIAITKRATKIKDPRQHAHDLMSYVFSKKKQDDISIIGMSRTLMDMTPLQATTYMEALAGASVTARGSTMHHVVLCYRDEDNITLKQKHVSIARILKRLGAENLEFIAIEHRDTLHQHIHLIINRVNPDTFRVDQLGGRWAIRETVKEIARINHDFGWNDPVRSEIRNAKWTVNGTGEVVRNNRDDIDITQGARDGEWAARRQGVEDTTGDRVYAFRQAWRERQPMTWQEFHELAAEHGLAYHRRGKGAVWDASPPNNTMQTIKASSALELSFRKLESRYGQWESFDRRKYDEKKRKLKEEERQRQELEFNRWANGIWNGMLEAGMTPTEEDVQSIKQGQIPLQYIEWIEQNSVNEINLSPPR